MTKTAEIYVEDCLVLKPGKEIPVLARHHWIFSGAVESYPEKQENGEIVPVLDSKQQLIGHALVNYGTSLVGRIISFGDQDPNKAIISSVTGAINLRTMLFDPKVTNAFRVINSEGDLLPGLIVDKYNDILVIQSTTAGMDKLKPLIVKLLKKAYEPKAIYEKSNSPSRKQEALGLQSGLLEGTETETTFLENKIKFSVDVAKAQKTAFFLDQREMRQLVAKYAPGRQIFNCFSYSGAMSIYALLNGAKSVINLDISAPAIASAKVNYLLNKLPVNDKEFICGDALNYLAENNLENYDFIILDPPAFAKTKRDVPQAIYTYRDINAAAIAKIAPKGLLLTSSCSYHVDETLFKKIIFQAALKSGRKVSILTKHIQALDHPLNIYHPENDYLKSFLLYVN
ncbi:MAG: class I SAM-dependent rRNA methyltransferase [bacterium]